MNNLPHDLYRAAQVRELDRIAIEEYGLGDGVLMQRAGHAAFDILRLRWPRARRLAVFCGAGNNGGDGYVVACLAQQCGWVVDVYQVGDHSRLDGDALSVHAQACELDIPMHVFRGEAPKACDVIVDGLLGTGLTGEVKGIWGEAIKAINASDKPVLALDIPSGLDADSGAVLGLAVKADVTVTFIGMKQGLLTGQGSEYCGELLFSNLGVPSEVYSRLVPSAQRLDSARLLHQLGPRRRDAHKGDFGHVLVVGGELGMPGAARLAAEAAARVGAGLVSIATREHHAGLLSVQRPELMSHGVETIEQLNPLLERASVIAIGPGLGRGEWARMVFSRVMESHKPLVIDADGLNLLGEDPLRHPNWVLTPHPGEAARLLGCDVQEIQNNRFAALASLEASYGGVCLLKGAGTLVLAADGEVGLCDRGNPGMACGGMGDLLTGTIAGLIAQGLSLLGATRLGVCLHGEAANLAAADGERGMLASDLLPQLRKLVNSQVF